MPWETLFSSWLAVCTKRGPAISPHVGRSSSFLTKVSRGPLPTLQSAGRPTLSPSTAGIPGFWRCSSKSETTLRAGLRDASSLYSSGNFTGSSGPRSPHGSPGLLCASAATELLNHRPRLTAPRGRS
ncbi:uncharacterized protein LOC123589365 isoform X6 [Leopardus geoffroyi]|uniref:uncharacterized protein LOC123589365 isoform X6 n=1 Tax=Leopardus geoffroyi TaxID=46844 RepID=UPI001E25FC34|nr:uncharacterized protein LOC123589365 isoform X6 [Leopardus geoffroyi]